MVVSARPYNFTASSSDNRREHCGWGFPNLQDMYDNRDKTILIDETQVITQGETQVVMAGVEPGEASFKVSLNWSEPAGNPSASSQLVNNLSLRVTSPTGVVYWGNNGLLGSMWSSAGGTANSVDTVENVYVQNPEAGSWSVEVVPPYLWAVYSNGLVARHARSSSERCPEHVTTRCSQMLRVQTREGAQKFMWGCSTRCVGQGWCIIVYGAVGK